jgi:hypothetical protein
LLGNNHWNHIRDGTAILITTTDILNLMVDFFPAACSEEIILQSKSISWQQNGLYTPSARGKVDDFDLNIPKIKLLYTLFRSIALVFD